jgi:hypothetical protein
MSNTSSEPGSLYLVWCSVIIVSHHCMSLTLIFLSFTTIHSRGLHRPWLISIHHINHLDVTHGRFTWLAHTSHVSQTPTSLYGVWSSHVDCMFPSFANTFFWHMLFTLDMSNTSSEPGSPYLVWCSVIIVSHHCMSWTLIFLSLITLRSLGLHRPWLISIHHINHHMSHRGVSHDYLTPHMCHRHPHHYTEYGQAMLTACFHHLQTCFLNICCSLRTWATPH